MASFALGGVPGMGGSAGREALRQATREAPGLIQGGLTTLGRPGFILRNILAGEWEDAAGQAAVLGSQLLSAPFTGGVSLIYPDVSALGLSDYLFGTGSAEDYAPFESQLEFSDLLSPETRDLLDAENGWRRVAIDVLGGVITDPLTLITGGAGGVGRAGTGLVAGSLRGSAPNVMRALRATRRGRAMADEAVDAARRALGSRATNDAVEQAAALSVMEEAFRRGPMSGAAGPVPAMFQAEVAQVDRLTAATRQLMSEGAMAPFTVRLAGREFGIPNVASGGLTGKLAGEFVHDLVNPFNRNFLASMLGGAALGPAGALIGRAAMKFSPVDDMVTKAVSSVSRKLVDRFADPRLPAPLRQELRALFGGAKSEGAELARRVKTIYGGPEAGNDVPWTPEQMEALTEHFEWINQRIAFDRARATAASNFMNRRAAMSTGGTLDLDAEVSAALNQLQLASMPGATQVNVPLARKILRAIDAMAMPSESEYRALLKAHAFGDDVFDNLIVQGGRNRVDEAIELHLNAMQQIQKERVGLRMNSQLPRQLAVGDTVQLTDEIKASGKSNAPFYEVVERYTDNGFLLRNTRSGKILRRKLDPVKKSAPDAVTRPGDYQIVGTLARPLPQAGMRVDELFYTSRQYQPWVERLLGEDANVKSNPFRFRRRTGTRTDFEATGKAKLLAKYPAGTPEHQQVKDLVDTLGAEHGLSVRALPVLTLNRATRHYVDKAAHKANMLAEAMPQFKDVIEEASKDVRREIVNKLGKVPTVLKALSQVNRRWKGLLTSVNPSFHFRNWLGTLFQTLQTENVTAAQGLGLWLATGAALPNAVARWVTRWRGGMPGIASNRMQQYIDAVYGDRNAWDALAGATIPGTQIGVQAALRAASGRLLKQNQVQREILDDLLGDHMTVLLKRGSLDVAEQDRGRIVGTIDALTKAGGEVANFVEDRMRLGTFMQILKNVGAGKNVNGRDAIERAIQETNRAFVDYDIQSVADYWLRQLVPFARFPIATLGPAMRAMRDRPIYRGIPRAIMAEGEREGVAQPEQVRRGFDVPLGGGARLSGLGSPLQAVDELTRALPGPVGDAVEGARRGALAQVQPGVGAAIGALTDTNLYWGGPFWKSRIVDGPVGDALERLGAGRRGEDGAVRVDPQVQAALESLPFSRQFRSALDLAGSFDKGEVGKGMLNFMTGLQSKQTLSDRELEALAETYFQRRVRQGDLNVYRRFYQQGQVDPELQALIKAA
ncbi:MAG: hypothetical protein JSV86_06075, partial [Gemmatimonadota bacterium]